MTKRIWLGATLVVSVAIIVWGTLVREIETIDTITIARGDIESTVAALGTLQPRDYVDVGAQVSGQIRRIHVQAGDVVKKGQLLAEIDPSLQQAKVDVARASLASLTAQLAERRAQHELAQQEYARQQTLAASEATRERDVQEARTKLRTAVARIADLKAQVDGARSRLKGEEAQLGYTRIYATMPGTVVTLDAREGQTLNAMQQTPLILRIADLSVMTVWTEVSEADIGRVRPGMPVHFTTLGAQERRWEGTVRQILPAPPNPPGQLANNPATSGKSAGSKVVLYTALFDVGNGNGELKPQMSAQVFFSVVSTKDAVTAPLRALKAVDGETDTYTADVLNANGRISTREVKTGVRDRLMAQVLSGLEPGDKLVTGVHRVRAGASVFTW